MYGRIVSEAYGYTITRFVTEEEKQCLGKSQRISVPELMPKDKLLILTIGSHVRHRHFGDGLVINVKKMGSDALLEIAFQDGTSRNLMQKLASTKMQLLSDESVL